MSVRRLEKTKSNEPIRTNARTTSISADKIALIPKYPSPGIPKKFSKIMSLYTKKVLL